MGLRLNTVHLHFTRVMVCQFAKKANKKVHTCCKKEHSRIFNNSNILIMIILILFSYQNNDTIIDQCTVYTAWIDLLLNIEESHLSIFLFS